MPLPAPPTLSGEEEECNLADVDLSSFGKTTESERTAHDEDEEEGHGTQRVQCGQN